MTKNILDRVSRSVYATTTLDLVRSTESEKNKNRTRITNNFSLSRWESGRVEAAITIRRPWWQFSQIRD